MSSAKKIASKIATAAAVLGISAIATAGMSGTAQAANNTFKLCNWGSGYNVTAEFPNRGGFSTYVAFPGKCVETGIGNNEVYDLHVQKQGNSAYFYTTLLKTRSSGRTQVDTWGQFGFDKFKHGQKAY